MKKFCLASLFLALDVVLVRLLSINTWNMKLNLGFVALAATAHFCGVKETVLVAALGDILGAILFPVGAFNPAFTVTAALTGLVYGLMFSREAHYSGIWGFIVIVVLNNFLLGSIINTALISAFYGVPYPNLLPLRLAQFFVQSLIELPALLALLATFERIDQSRP